jgi:hypothetical protein
MSPLNDRYLFVPLAMIAAVSAPVLPNLIVRRPCTVLRSRTDAYRYFGTAGRARERPS